MRSAIVAARLAEAVERRQRHEHVVADAVDVDDDAVRMLLENACRGGARSRPCGPCTCRQLVARRCAARLRGAPAPRAAGGCECTWQMATASASAASCGDGTAVEPEQQLDHLLHLLLLGAAVADDRALDLGRRVLDDRHARLDRREHRDAARVTELQRAAHVDRRRNRFSIATQSGRHSREERGEPAVNRAAACRETTRAPGVLIAPHDDDAMARPVGLDAAVTGALGAGVDAEDPHASEASISFSSMSKFDQTCCTSS